MIEIAKAFAHGVMCGCNIEDVHVADEWYGGEYFDVNVFGSYWGDFDDPYALKVVVYKVVDGDIQFEQVLYTAFLLRANAGKDEEFSIEDYLSESDNQDILKQVDAQGPWIAENLYKDEVTLASLRLRAGLSQKTLAELCGWKQPTIASYETGSTIPSLLAASKIAKALGIGVEELVVAFENSSNRVAGDGRR